MTEVESRPRVIAPVLTLFFLAPFVAEFLLGNMAIDALPAIAVLAPLYGGGALLVREMARRGGGGWRSIFLLALAYGLVEEGLAIQTLFNPNYFGLHLLDEAPVPALGMGAWWTLFVLTLHTVWSITVPIAITEALFPARARSPWLGRASLSFVAVLYLAGGALVYVNFHRHDAFRASPAQLAGTVLAIAAAIAAARLRRAPPPVDERPPPSPWLVGATALLAGLAFMAPHEIIRGWPLVAWYLGLYAAVAGVLRRWSRRRAWSAVHETATAAGALLTYAIVAFPAEPIVGSKGSTDLIGNGIFAALAVVLLAVAFRRVSGRRGAA